MAVPGGSSPAEMFRLLAGEDYRRLIPWAATHVFFTDERCVPPDSPDSNFRLANELLFSGVPECRVHRFETELAPVDAAAKYEDTMRSVMGERPIFDLVVLGMGADTHTASLFPDSPALTESKLLAAHNPVGGAIGDRLTLTLPALCDARSVVVLVLGDQKSQALQIALQGPFDPVKHPVQAVRPTNGTLIWITWQQAAAML